MVAGWSLWCLLGLTLLLCVTSDEDRLRAFYDRLQKEDVRYCADKTRLLPDCKECIPGLQQGQGQTTCDEYIPSSRVIRDEIKKLTDERYGDKPVVDRPFGLYPYLEKADFMSRQLTFGKMLSAAGGADGRHIMDVGAYYNPINLFLATHVCPASVVVVEPILDALSAMLPCTPAPGAAVGGTGFTHILFLPITFKQYTALPANQVPAPSAVVCIGCDSHYGPNRRLLETSFPKPYTLYLEYPSEYVHNQPFKKMQGDGKGEELLFIKKFQPATNETQYTKRVMKVIHYEAE